MENEKRKVTPYDGRRAKITEKSHPHFNAIAECLGAELTSLGKWGMVFKCIETEIEFFIFNGKEVKWIDCPL